MRGSQIPVGGSVEAPARPGNCSPRLESARMTSWSMPLCVQNGVMGEQIPRSGYEVQRESGSCSPRSAMNGHNHVMARTEDRRDLAGSGDWRRELYEASPEREGELFSTISGLENEPLYSAEDVEINPDRDLGYPGVFPFTRGVYPSMYRGRLWTMRQFA